VSGQPQAALLADGRRLHLQHGPIDLIIEAFGRPAEVAAAYRQAQMAFRPVLARLVAELPLLRRPLTAAAVPVRGPVARRMVAACRPHARVFITPMAAVAGAVAEYVLDALVAGRRLDKAYVNNGGDIALYLAPGQRFEVGIVGSLAAPQIEGRASIAADGSVRGIATSGQGGRSFSLGIADAVTVLARTAAAADAAATLVANAVTIDSDAVIRAPASTLREDTDLGSLPVVVGIGPLTTGEVDQALAAGAAVAAEMGRDGLIEAAYLSLRGRHWVVGGPAPVLTQAAQADAA
jgi:hypothetical protein